MTSVNLSEGDAAAKDTAAPSSDVAEEEEAAMLMSGVKAELVNWQEAARPTESVIVGLLIVVLACALSGDDWLSGATDRGVMVHVGLDTATEDGRPSFDLADSCGSTGNSTSVVCALSSAGDATALCGWLGFVVALTLAIFFIIDALAQRGLLTGVRAKLPPAIPLDKVGELTPLLCWSLLLLLIFLTLLLYAAQSPGSLGGGPVSLGFSYGLARLALLLALAGLTVHLSLVRQLGEDQMVAALDSLRGHWSHLARRQQAIQLLLALSLLFELLLWLRRVEWAWMVVAYGLWAYTQHSHDHLCAFCALAIFSVGTDAIELVATGDDFGLLVPTLMWLSLVAKSSAVAMIVYSKEAFAR